MKNRDFLTGHMLIAMPDMNDSNFQKSVVFICAHSEDGAMGIIVNHPKKDVNFGQLLEQLNIVGHGDRISLPPSIHNRPVHQGGPVEKSRGFILHSADYFVERSTVRIGPGICLTATLDILKAMANGDGPNEALFALGYAGWGAGQLEKEILDNGWLHCKGEAELLFEGDSDRLYHSTLAKLGIDPAFLSTQAGQA